MPTTVDNVRLEANANLQLTGGPAFSTNIIRSQGGWRQGNINWEYALWKVRLRFVKRGEGDFDEIISFFLARRGPAYPFLVKDPKDFEAGANGKVLLIDGDYRLVKEYPDTIRPYRRIITRPVDGTITLSSVEKSGGGFCTAADVDLETGIIANAVGEGTWTGEFDIPVAFQQDAMDYDYSVGDIADWTVELEEVRID